MFSGTLRFNLDPMEKYSDTEIWDCLEAVNLKKKVSSFPTGLNTMISPSGNNMSKGERQLVCLARALLKKSNIVVIDEATANIDSATDQLIQRTIRTEFAKCTVLTIAHRLATIADSDRVICMSKGEVKAFDKPSELLNDESSMFFEFCSKLTESDKRIVTEIVKSKSD